VLCWNCERSSLAGLVNAQKEGLAVASTRACAARLLDSGEPPIRGAVAVTDGLAVLAAWLMFAVLVAALVVVVLRGDKGGRR
jgi:hypothetical protein